jgi:hypothetical protein
VQIHSKIKTLEVSSRTAGIWRFQTCGDHNFLKGEFLPKKISTATMYTLIMLKRKGLFFTSVQM